MKNYLPFPPPLTARFVAPIVVLGVFALFSSAKPACAQYYPFPQQVTYAAGLKPNNYGQSQMNADVLAAYNLWRARWVVKTGTEQVPGGGTSGNVFRVRTGSQNRPMADRQRDDTVSEGIGYGMLISVLMDNGTNDAHAVYDGLFRYYTNSLS